METENYRRVNIPTLIPPLLPGRAERWLPPGCRRRRAGLGRAERGPAGAARPRLGLRQEPPRQPRRTGRGRRPPSPAAGGTPGGAGSGLARPSAPGGSRGRGRGVCLQRVSAQDLGPCAELGGQRGPAAHQRWRSSAVPAPWRLARLAAPYWAAPLGSAAARRGQGAGLSRHSSCKQRSSPLPLAGTRAGGLRESRARRTRCEAYPRYPRARRVPPGAARPAGGAPPA